jgi:hypothetical protein
MNKWIRLLTIATLLSVAILASASNVVREFQGTDSTTTAEFKVDGPWLLDWRLNGDYDNFVALDIALIDAKTGRHVGRVLHTKYKGNGVKLFDEGGRYQLRVSSTLARWHIKIEQITREEAELYTPRKQE